jgi:hypothetical protein
MGSYGGDKKEKSIVGKQWNKVVSINSWYLSQTYSKRVPLKDVGDISEDDLCNKLGCIDASLKVDYNQQHYCL